MDKYLLLCANGYKNIVAVALVAYARKFDSIYFLLLILKMFGKQYLFFLLYFSCLHCNGNKARLVYGENLPYNITNRHREDIYVM